MWLVRFTFFKLMLMAGAVKVQSHCPTWLNLTATEYHFATQCLPTPAAWLLHQLPQPLQQLSVAITLWIEGPATLLLLTPAPLPARFGVALQLLLQLLILFTGNYNFFNVATMGLCLAVLGTSFGPGLGGAAAPAAAAAAKPEDVSFRRWMDTAWADLVSLGPVGAVCVWLDRLCGSWFAWWTSLAAVGAFSVLTWEWMFEVLWFGQPLAVSRMLGWGDGQAGEPLPPGGIWAVVGGIWAAAGSLVAWAASMPTATQATADALALFDDGLRVRLRLSVDELDSALDRILMPCVVFAATALALSSLVHVTNELCVLWHAVSLEGPVVSSEGSVPNPVQKTIGSRVVGGLVGVLRVAFAVTAACMCGLAFAPSALFLTSLRQETVMRKLPAGFFDTYSATRQFSLSSPYGLFRRMTGVGADFRDTATGRVVSVVERPELILEVGQETEGGLQWQELEFVHKPGDVFAAPTVTIPHQPRLDWQMWFAALNPSYQQAPWVVSLADKLLEQSPDVLSLLDRAPLPGGGRPWAFVRGSLWHYDFTRLPLNHTARLPPPLRRRGVLSREDPANDSAWDAWWHRERVSGPEAWLPSLQPGRDDVAAILKQQGWARITPQQRRRLQLERRTCDLASSDRLLAFPSPAWAVLPLPAWAQRHTADALEAVGWLGCRAAEAMWVAETAAERPWWAVVGPARLLGRRDGAEGGRTATRAYRLGLPFLSQWWLGETAPMRVEVMPSAWGTLAAAVLLAAVLLPCLSPARGQ